MKDKIIGIIIVLAMFYGGAYLVDAVITREEVRDITNRANDERAGVKVEEKYNRSDAKSEWMSGCNDGTNTEYCSCGFDEIVNATSVNILLDNALSMSENELVNWMKPYIEKCYYLLDTNSI